MRKRGSFLYASKQEKVVDEARGAVWEAGDRHVKGTPGLYLLLSV